MTEVVDTNWPAMFKKMEAALSKAIFVAIDNEFSGLRDQTKEDISLFDDNASRYSKIKYHVEEFRVIQFGISFFYFDPDSKGYTSDVFTVYLFPRTCGRVDVPLKFQASAVEFLCRHKFDFNKMMHKGIPYIPLSEHEDLKQALADGTYMKQQMARFSVDIMDLHKSLCSQVMAWEVGAKEGDEMRLSKTPFLLPFLLHKDLRNSSPNILTRSDTETGDILVRKVSIEARRRDDDAIREQEDQDAFDSLIGFSKFITLLIEKDVPIVGHNLLLDLMMMFQQFIGPLPDSYNSFKRKLIRSFPTLFDTKFLSVEIKKKHHLSDAWDSDLQKLYNYLTSDKCENFAPGAPKISTSSYNPAAGDEILEAGGDACQKVSKGHFHDAGWDSYCSGVVFILLAYINTMIDEDLKGEEEKTDNEPCNHCWEDLLKSVQTWKNKVHISMGQSTHIHLSGPDQFKGFNHIVHLQAIGKPLLLEEIEDIFLQFGSLDVKIFHPNKALIACSSQECKRDILKYCKNHPVYKAQTYSPWKHNLIFRSILWASGISTLGTGAILFLLSLRG